MLQLRKDPVVDRWVIIASERARRLKMVREPEKHEVSPCPFCYGNEGKTPPEIVAYRPPDSAANTPGWWTRVVPNKFPALQIEGDLDRAGIGIYDVMNGIGAHEVIIETPEHDDRPEAMDVKQLAEVLWVYKERSLDLRGDDRIRYILIFKNRGAIAGASLSHPHSQLIATPVVPKRVVEELRGARTYFRLKERCVFCDIVREETNYGGRVVAMSDRFIAFVPFAPRFPFEVWLMPRRHRSSFDLIARDEVEDLAGVLRETLLRLGRALAEPPYNYMIHTSPCRERDNEYYHWHIEITPRLVEVTGFEWGAGFYVNPTAPEDAAAYLRNVKLPEAVVRNEVAPA
jgi:UDPglucose--hexose-1-phosphate uridylyltransferase